MIVALLTGAAFPQYALDAKGRRYKCRPGHQSCSMVQPPRATRERGLTPDARRLSPPAPYGLPGTTPVDSCGSRCDLLDRMK